MDALLSFQDQAGTPCWPGSGITHLGVAASAVAFIGWFGALLTGRLPDFAATYLSGYVRWYCRAAAYLLLLTDEYPPFLFQDAAYPVRVAVSPGRLNRLAVPFRLALATPVAILSMILLSGLATIVIFTAWLTALIAGKLPRSLHQAFAAVLRYSTRYYGYLYLLTDTYPRGLFGDKPGIGAEDLPGDHGYGMTGPRHGAPDPAYPPAADYNAPPGYGPPGYPTPVPGYGEPAPGYPAAPVPRHRAAAYETPSQPATWQMVLPVGAKRLVGLILMLGLATSVGAGVRHARARMRRPGGSPRAPLAVLPAHHEKRQRAAGRYVPGMSGSAWPDSLRKSGIGVDTRVCDR